MTVIVASGSSNEAAPAEETSPQKETANEASADTGFQYGWAKTDHKSGEKLRPEWRDDDYMHDEPYATSVRNMLEKLGLPFPKDEEIFRGTHHDLLFLNSHGVVVRIGPTDVTDLMNPAILQPLGWLEDEKVRVKMKDSGWYSRKVETPLTVAIYPGIELYKHFNKDVKKVGDIHEALTKTGQGTGDVGYNNDGIIRILDDNGEEKAVEVLLDSDNLFNYSSKKTTSERSAQLFKAAGLLENGADIMASAMQATFKKASSKLKYFQRAFEAHQPLRRLFWNAFGDVFAGVEGAATAQQKEAQQKFWDALADVTHNAHAAIMPVWSHQEKEGEGTTVRRDEIFVPQVVLYHQWTGKKEDKTVQPIRTGKIFKESVQRKHKALVQGEASGGAQAPAEAMPVFLQRVPEPMVTKAPEKLPEGLKMPEKLSEPPKAPEFNVFKPREFKVPEFKAAELPQKPELAKVLDEARELLDVAKVNAKKTPKRDPELEAALMERVFKADQALPELIRVIEAAKANIKKAPKLG